MGGSDWSGGFGCGEMNGLMRVAWTTRLESGFCISLATPAVRDTEVDNNGILKA